ncbi:hypothetical protein RAJCM14343_1540 [Rhodococcus aetherivorans]|uniref:Uncharacterized protein n=2 Tax=Rhodococcus TaxID=1827 RepID=A0ABQ0YIC8_9NOCA|nr:hypothetical protein RAJCM14343_1540 [Rhodococcus aetherivorans]CCW11993.1 hypothetical protein EBESD8_25390 [Rhodococcus aetherivorans]CDZ87533.1 hypothetical protein RHRU231_30061 [Rhodococcus ruber]
MQNFPDGTTGVDQLNTILPRCQDLVSTYHPLGMTSDRR